MFHLKLYSYLKHHWAVLWIASFILTLLINLYGILIWIKDTKGIDNPVFLLLDLIYYTLYVFTLESLPEGAENAYIRISRALAPMLFISLSAGALISFFKDKIRLFYAHHFYRNHWLLCGLSEATISLIEKLEKKSKVAVLEENESNPFLLYCKTKGIPALISEGSLESSYLRLGIDRASGVFLTFDEDLKNVLMANKLSKLKGQGFRIYAHIKDFWLKHYYDNVAIQPSGVEVVYVNFYEDMARRLFLKVPLDEGVHKVEKPWIVIVGTDEAGLAVLLQTLKSKVYPGDKRLRLTLVGPKAEEVKGIINSRFVMDGIKLFEALGVDFEFIRKEYECINSAEDLCIGEEKPQAVIVCTQRDMHTKRISGELEKLGTKVISLYSMLYAKEGEGLSFNLYDLATESLLQRETLDKMAKLVHLNYLRSHFPEVEAKDLYHFERELKSKYAQKLQEKAKKKEAVNLWENLKEVYRNSNRNYADHIWEKLRVIDSSLSEGKELKPEDIENIERALKDRKLVEMLAELEFKRYLRERALLRDYKKLKDYWDNYKFTYEALPEEEKESYNVKPIREDLPTILRNYAGGML
ncbi:MAG: NAD-binding protein [Aquificaceae bacterium]|nr:NAD-binding protein [Aquificaceae bacterium]MDW8424272.1 NAD-binding protein [Aquificaceae bacterium]